MTEYEQNGKEYTVTYDLDNRIITADVDNNDVEYRYDAFGRRVIRKEGSTTTSLIWWGNSECAEHKHQAGQTVIQNDIFEHPSRLNSVIARAIDGSKFKLQWYHKNYLDHVYGVSDDSGAILEHYRYTAFGEVSIYDQNGNLQNTTQIDNHILWNTRRRDEVTGYYMYKFRHYSAELGRWPSRDPIEERGGVNLYGFVGNQPTWYFDKLGLVEWWEDPLGHFTPERTPPPVDKDRAKGANCVGIAFRNYQNVVYFEDVEELFKKHKCEEIDCSDRCKTPKTKFYILKLKLKTVFVNINTGEHVQQGAERDDFHVGCGSKGDWTKFGKTGKLGMHDNDIIGPGTGFGIINPEAEDDGIKEVLFVKKVYEKKCYCCECFSE